MVDNKRELEYYLNGFVQAISSLKDIITPYLGGFNQFFSIHKVENYSVRENILAYLESETRYYNQFKEVDMLQEARNNLKLELIGIPETELKLEFPYWTCDKQLIEKFGQNGFLLSERLFDMIKDFFKDENYKLYKINSDELRLPWNDMMALDYVFETEKLIYVLHLGESS